MRRRKRKRRRRQKLPRPAAAARWRRAPRPVAVVPPAAAVADQRPPVANLHDSLHAATDGVEECAGLLDRIGIVQ
jgi:hypothetical protein